MRYAKLGLKGSVIDVLEVAEADCQDADGAFDENIGVEFLTNLTSWAIWKAGTTARHDKNLGIGAVYDDTIDMFKGPKPGQAGASWTFNTTSGEWDPPVAFPDDGEKYIWNEGTTSWDAL